MSNRERQIRLVCLRRERDKLQSEIDKLEQLEVAFALETSLEYPSCSIHGRYGGSDVCPKCSTGNR